MPTLPMPEPRSAMRRGRGQRVVPNQASEDVVPGEAVALGVLEDAEVPAEVVQGLPLLRLRAAGRTGPGPGPALVAYVTHGGRIFRRSGRHPAPSNSPPFGGSSGGLQLGQGLGLQVGFAEVRQARQVVQALEAEMQQELQGGGVHHGPAHHGLAPHRHDQLPLQQALHLVGAAGDAPQLVDLGHGHRLAVGDDGQGLDLGRGEPAAADGGHQLGHQGLVLGRRGQAPAAAHLQQAQAPGRPQPFLPASPGPGAGCLRPGPVSSRSRAMSTTSPLDTSSASRAPARSPPASQRGSDPGVSSIVAAPQRYAPSRCPTRTGPGARGAPPGGPGPPMSSTTVEPNWKVPRSSPGGAGQPGNRQGAVPGQGPALQPASVDDHPAHMGGPHSHRRHLQPCVRAGPRPPRWPGGCARRGAARGRCWRRSRATVRLPPRPTAVTRPARAHGCGGSPWAKGRG